MKKLFGFFVAVFLLCALSSPALALSDEAERADVLHTLGLLQGVGVNEDGSPYYALDRQPTRAEAVTMLVRLLGKDAEAREGEWDIPFADVEDWARPYVGYAYANGLTKGTGDTTFGGAALTDQRQYVTFLLRALGYSEAESDFTFSEALDFAAQIGLLEARETEEPFDRGDLVSDSYLALCTALKAEERTLSNKLLWDDVFTTLQLRDTYDGKLLVAADMPDYIETSYDAAIRVETEQELFDVLMIAIRDCRGGYLHFRYDKSTSTEETDKFSRLKSTLPPGMSFSDYFVSSAETGQPQWEKCRTPYWNINWRDYHTFWYNIDQLDEFNLQVYYSDPDRFQKSRLVHPENFENAEIDVDQPSWVSLISKLDEIMAEVIDETMTETEKAAALNAYLCRHVEYDIEELKQATVALQHALLEGKAVCYGYARTYKLLCLMAGLECEYVSAYAGSSRADAQNHGWNQVKLGEKWYNVDVTWNDAGADSTKYLFKSDAYMRANGHFSVGWWDNSPDEDGPFSEHQCLENL